MSVIKNEIYRIAENELFEAAQEQQEIQNDHKRQKRRAQALIASGLLLSTLMAAAVGETVGEARARPLNVAEADAISHLMDYVAFKMNASRDWVEEVILAEFKVRSLAELRAKHYDAVIDYLLHLVH